MGGQQAAGHPAQGRPYSLVLTLPLSQPFI